MAREGKRRKQKPIRVPPVIFALGDREQCTYSGVTLVTRPLYYRGQRIGDINPDYAEPLMAALLASPGAEE